MIHSKIGLQQRIFPSYRKTFFEQLASACPDGFSLFAGEAEEWEHVNAAQGLDGGTFAQAKNLHLGKGKYYFCYQRNLIAWLKQWNPDCLILEANPRYLSNWRAIRWMKKRKRGVIGWGLGAPNSGSGGMQRFWKQFLCNFDAVISYSQIGAKEYASLGIVGEQIFVAPNAILPAPPHAYQQRPQRQSLHLLYVGRLQARKKVDALLHACACLNNEGKQISLVIVGEGPEVGRLRTLADEVFPAANFTGALHGDAVRPYFEQADLFVLPGTGGLAVQEAMSYGLPVIVAEADGTQSNLVRPENGWVIDSNEPDGLLAALRQAWQQREQLPKMGRVSFEIASTEVNTNRMVDVFAEAILFAQKKRQGCEF